MAYDPEARLKYCAEQRVRRRAEEEKKQAEEYQCYLNAGGTPKRSGEEQMFVGAEHPNTMEDGIAILLYIVVMVVGAIFVDRWLIWIIASFIYFRFISRKAIRQKNGMKRKRQVNINQY